MHRTSIKAGNTHMQWKALGPRRRILVPKIIPTSAFGRLGATSGRGEYDAHPRQRSAGQGGQTKKTKQHFRAVLTARRTRRSFSRDRSTRAPRKMEEHPFVPPSPLPFLGYPRFAPPSTGCLLRLTFAAQMATICAYATPALLCSRHARWRLSVASTQMAERWQLGTLQPRLSTNNMPGLTCFLQQRP